MKKTKGGPFYETLCTCKICLLIHYIQVLSIQFSIKLITSVPWKDRRLSRLGQLVSNVVIHAYVSIAGR